MAEANDGQQALSMCRELSPDLVLMDVRMPVMDGLEATRRIKAEMPQVSVMMVTMHENPDYLFEAVKAGAAGYVLKDASGERLLGAVRRTLEGESPLNQELAMRLLVRLARERDGGSEADESAAPERVAPRLRVEPSRSGWRRQAVGEPDAEGGRGLEAPKPGADQPPDRPQSALQREHRKGARAQHPHQTRSIRPHPGRRPRHRVQIDHRLGSFAA